MVTHARRNMLIGSGWNTCHEVCSDKRPYDHRPLAGGYKGAVLRVTVKMNWN